MWATSPAAGRGQGSLPVMELARLFVDILVTSAKAAIGFAFLLWLAGRFGITGLSALLGKAGI